MILKALKILIINKYWISNSKNINLYGEVNESIKYTYWIDAFQKGSKGNLSNSSNIFLTYFY